MKKLYVGNLPYSVDQGQLQELFSEHGDVASVAIITDRDTGQPRGFGFVEYTNDADANKAIESMNGREIDGRTLTVNVAKEREPRGGGGGGGRGRGGW
jgi:cold-inducible RNA-binding protein